MNSKNLGSVLLPAAIGFTSVIIRSIKRKENCSMDTRIFIRFGAMILFLAGLLVVTSPAKATEGTLCGQSTHSTLSSLTVSIDAACESRRTYDWDISTSASPVDLTLSPGQTSMVDYTVTARARATTYNTVAGDLVFENESTTPIIVIAVLMTLSSNPITCPQPFPLTIGAGQLVECTFSGTLINDTPGYLNLAVEANGDVEALLISENWQPAIVTETDGCATITDTNSRFPGLPQTVCAGEEIETSFTFAYSRRFGPYATCGDYQVNNTAAFTTSDTGTTRSASDTVNVHVPCEVR
jgi:hypothetical protein